MWTLQEYCEEYKINFTSNDQKKDQLLRKRFPGVFAECRRVAENADFGLPGQKAYCAGKSNPTYLWNFTKWAIPRRGG
jgi:hypothetical protein